MIDKNTTGEFEVLEYGSPNGLSVIKSVDSGIPVLELAGRFSPSRGVDVVKENIAQAIKSGTPLLLDFRGVSFLNHDSVGVLVPSAYKEVGNGGDPQENVGFFGIKGSVASKLEMMKIDSKMNIFSNRAAALEWAAFLPKRNVEDVHTTSPVAGVAAGPQG